MINPSVHMVNGMVYGIGFATLLLVFEIGNVILSICMCKGYFLQRTHTGTLRNSKSHENG